MALRLSTPDADRDSHPEHMGAGSSIFRPATWRHATKTSIPSHPIRSDPPWLLIDRGNNLMGILPSQFQKRRESAKMPFGHANKNQNLGLSSHSWPLSIRRQGRSSCHNPHMVGPSLDIYLDRFLLFCHSRWDMEVEMGTGNRQLATERKIKLNSSIDCTLNASTFVALTSRV